MNCLFVKLSYWPCHRHVLPPDKGKTSKTKYIKVFLCDYMNRNDGNAKINSCTIFLYWHILPRHFTLRFLITTFHQNIHVFQSSFLQMLKTASFMGHSAYMAKPWLFPFASHLSKLYIHPINLQLRIMKKRNWYKTHSMLFFSITIEMLKITLATLW